MPARILLLLALAAAARADESAAWRPLDRRCGLPSDDVFDLCRGGPDRVWAATGAGLCLLSAHEIRRAGPPGVCRHLAEGAAGSVYALYPQGIAHIREAGHIDWIELPEAAAGRTFRGLVAEPDGTLALYTGAGVFRREAAGVWTAAPGPPPTPPPEADVRVHGEVWRPTRGAGILRRRERPLFTRHPLRPGARVHAMAAHPDGSVWCATEDGLARLQDGGVTTVTAIAGRALGVVTACVVDRQGRVWIGSGSSFTGVYRLDGGRWEHLAAIDAHVHRMSLDAAGVVWFATLNREGQDTDRGRGAWYFAQERFHPVTALSSLPSARVYDVVARDAKGVLWFATLKGLAAYEGPDRITPYTPEEHGLPGEKVWCLCAARDGSLWIGYQLEKGVSRLAQGRFVHYDVADGLCDGNVWSIAEGRPGVFWFATRNGLSRFDGRRWSCFRDEEGLGDAPIWPLLPLPDGRLWIGTLGEGAVEMTPRDTSAPKTRFAATHYETAAERALTIRWEGRDAWFDTPGRELWYRWRLDGGRWSRAAPARETTLTLAPGSYTFEVQAFDRFGNAEDPPAAVRIAVPDATGVAWPWIAGAAVVLLALGFLIGRRDRA